MDYLLKVSERFSEIIGTIKYYPYPAIVYKISFNKLFEGGSLKNDRTGNTAEQAIEKVEEKKIVVPVAVAAPIVAPIVEPVAVETQFIVSTQQLTTDQPSIAQSVEPKPQESNQPV